MEKYVINGGKPLQGEVEISGAKNAAVAIIPAALMVDGVCRIENMPQISDTDMQIYLSTVQLAILRLGIHKSVAYIDYRTEGVHALNVLVDGTDAEVAAV